MKFLLLLILFRKAMTFKLKISINLGRSSICDKYLLKNALFDEEKLKQTKKDIKKDGEIKAFIMIR